MTHPAQTRFPALPACDAMSDRLVLAAAGMALIPCVLAILTISFLAIRGWKAIKEVTIGISNTTRRRAPRRPESP